VQTTLPFGKYVMEHDALDLEILILHFVKKKVLQRVHHTKGNGVR
jgi:hypothetical protein